jgi:PAS domain S-box-containing protein
MENLSSLTQNIISVSPVPTAIVDINMRYLAISASWISFYHLQDVQLIGASHYDIFPEIGQHWKAIHAACLQGKDSSNANERFERPDGSATYLKWEVRHFRDEQGAIAGMMMTSEDVSKNTGTLLNENRFQLFMDHFPGLCWISGSNQVLKYANKCFYQTLQLTPEVIGKKSAEIFGNDIAAAANVQDQKVLESGEGIDFEQTSRDQHGHPKVYKVYKFPFNDAAGEGNMVGSLAFDITKSTLLREELDKSEAQFKLAFEHSLIGMALISPDGNWKRVNNSLCQMLGYSAQEMKTLSVHNLTHPNDRERSLALLSELSSGSIERTKFEKRYLHKNGNTIWVIIAATMLYGNDGQPLYYVSQIEDITRRKEIENDLILSEKKYRTIFENVQDVFYQTDQNGVVTEISPSIEKYSGYTRENIIGKPVSDFYFYPHDRDRIVESLRNDGYVIDFEVRLKTNNQELRYASVNARLVIENGKFAATEGSMRDVTARKFQENTLRALNSELTESNQQKNKLLSIIGHDLRNPIAGSLQLIDLTIDDLETVGADEIKTYLLTIREELSNATNLLEDLLEWARSQFSALTFNPVLISSIEELVKKSMKTVTPMAAKKDINIDINVPEGISLEADTAMLETIIRNLLSNAVKFTPIAGGVSLSVTAHQNEIKFAIQDTGVGIQTEKIALLFGKHSFTTYGTQGEKGTGLGLGLCHDFVSRHNGQIWAESEVGKGTRFYFTIPKRRKKE